MRLFAIIFSVLLALPLLSQANVKTFTLTDTTFEKGSVMRGDIEYNQPGGARLRPESSLFLDSFAAFIASHPGMVVEIGSHSDQRGTNTFNLKMTQMRAVAVYEYLILHGVSPDQLVDSGYGETKPVYSQFQIDSDTSKANKEKMYRANRRTEFKLLRVPDCFFSLTDTKFTPGCVFRTYAIRWTLSKTMPDSSSYPLLDSVAAMLLNNPRMAFEVGCHTDSRSGEEYSRKLSYSRAYAIIGYLSSKGVPANSLWAKGYGETEPLLFEKQVKEFPEQEREAAHQRNRRTEIRFLFEKPSVFPVVTPAFTLADTTVVPGVTLIGGHIRFALNKDSLFAESFPFLDSVADFMKRNPGVVLEVSSHADARASTKYSTNLTQKRAQSMVNYLVSKGIARERLAAKGYHNVKPARLSDGTVLTEKYISTKPSKEEQELLHSWNRRQEFKVIAVNPPPLPLTIANGMTNGLIRTYSIRFLLNKDSLLAESYPFLDSMFVFMQSNPDAIVEVGVHLDARANPNSHLTMNRASEITMYLIRKGIRKDRLIAKGYGSVAPLRLPGGTVLTEKYILGRPANEQEALHALNRRVEFRITALRAHATIPYSRTSNTFSLSDTIFAEGSVLVLSGILYDLNRETLRPEAYVHLDSVAAFLLRYPYLDVEIAVHTDSRVSEKSSYRVSGPRAKTVVGYLISKGVAQERIVAKGYEDTQPRRLPDGTLLTEKYIMSKPAKEEQEKLHQLNRRTEIRIVRVN